MSQDMSTVSVILVLLPHLVYAHSRSYWKPIPCHQVLNHLGSSELHAIALSNVTFDHMDIALSKVFKSTVVDTILCLPQHQQMVLCALANTFQHCTKKATTLGELNKSYIEICRSTQVLGVGMLEFSNMCMILSDQGFMKLGQSKEDKLRRVMLQIDSLDIKFAFKGNRFFQKFLEQPNF